MAKKKAPAAQPAPLTLDTFAAEHARLLDVGAKAPENLPGYGVEQGNPRDLAPRVPETDTWVEGQITNTRNAAEKWKANTLRPKRDPIVAAKAAKEKWKNAVTKAAQEDRFAKGLEQVDEADMIATIQATPSTAVADGVERRRGKIERKVGKLRNLMVGHLAAVDRMPTNTDAEREAKMLANLRGMRAVGDKMRE